MALPEDFDEEADQSDADDNWLELEGDAHGLAAPALALSGSSQIEEELFDSFRGRRRNGSMDPGADDHGEGEAKA